MKIERARASDLAGIRWLLSYENLPISDVSERLIRSFLVARGAHGFVGAIGIEPLGEVALLRSLVVAADQRGQGLGSQLTRAAEELASELQTSSLFLLTTTAAQFFSARGYRVIARDDVPLAIKQTQEFSSLCPATATVMVKP